MIGKSSCKPDKNDKHPVLIVEVGDTNPDSRPDTVGIINCSCQQILRIANSPSLEWVVGGEDPAILVGNVIFPPTFPAPDPPLPPPEVDVIPASYIRLERSESIIIPLTVGSIITPIPFDVVNDSNDLTLFTSTGGGIQVSEDNTYESTIRLAYVMLLGVFTSSTLEVLIDGVPTGVVDTIQYPFFGVSNVAAPINHILQQPLTLNSGDIVTARLTIVGLLEIDVIIPATGYMNLTRIQNVVGN